MLEYREMPLYRFAIKELFLAKGYKSAYSVARALNKKDTAAGRIMDPDRDRIGLDLVNELCEFFGCTPGDLFAQVQDVPTGNEKSKAKRKPSS